MAEAFPEGYYGVRSKGGVVSLREFEQSLVRGRRRFVAFIRELPPGASLLDAGCGGGKALRAIQALRPDISISAMDFADMQDYLPEGVHFIQGSAEELLSMYPATRFDAVICQHVVEHLLYPHHLVEGMYAVLKPGGALFIETPNWTRIFVPFSHLWFWNDYTHVRPFSRGAMARLLKESNFSIETLITFSSCRWFVKKGARTSATESTHPVAAEAYAVRGVPARIAARLINPLVRDTLIAIARKSE